MTSRSPISTRPEFTSSSPASIRSEVDFPQPDGPTRTRNSPSAISSRARRLPARSRPGRSGSRDRTLRSPCQPLLLHVAVHPARVVDEPCGSRQLDQRFHPHVGARGAEPKLEQPWLHDLITVAAGKRAEIRRHLEGDGGALARGERHARVPDQTIDRAHD